LMKYTTWVNPDCNHLHNRSFQLYKKSEKNTPSLLNPYTHEQNQFRGNRPPQKGFEFEEALRKDQQNLHMGMTYISMITLVQTKCFHS
jgi:hypothetical protein